MSTIQNYNQQNQSHPVRNTILGAAAGSGVGVLTGYLARPKTEEEARQILQKTLNKIENKKDILTKIVPKNVAREYIQVLKNLVKGETLTFGFSNIKRTALSVVRNDKMTTHGLIGLGVGAITALLGTLIFKNKNNN